MPFFLFRALKELFILFVAVLPCPFSVMEARSTRNKSMEYLSACFDALPQHPLSPGFANL